jgi:hypothetical protein
MSAAICLKRFCGGIITSHVVEFGRVVHSCARCERKARGICRDCPNPVYGRVGWALRCETCAAKKRALEDKRFRADPDVKRHIAARDRKKYRKNKAFRDRKRRQRREWAARHRDEVARAKRRFLMREGPSRDRYLATQRRHNADPVRAEKKRVHARARYYVLHPERPLPICAGCRLRLNWGGTGAPPKWCDDCCPAAEKSRRRRLGRSITVIREVAA